MGCSEVAIRYFSSSAAMTCGPVRIGRHSGGDAEEDLVQLVVELVELGRLRHLVLVHEERRHDLLVAALAEEVEAVRDERLVEVDAVVREEVPAVAGDLRSCRHRSADRSGALFTRDVPRSRSMASKRRRTSWWGMMSAFFSTWAFGPSGCHVLSVALSSWQRHEPSEEPRFDSCAPPSC
jgi:hypothetical protein